MTHLLEFLKILLFLSKKKNELKSEHMLSSLGYITVNEFSFSPALPSQTWYVCKYKF